MDYSCFNFAVLVGITFGCLLVIDTIPYTDAIDCYNCTKIRNATDCHNLQTCPPQIQGCVIYSEGPVANRTYTLGCDFNDLCAEPTTTPIVMATTMAPNDTDTNTTDADNTTTTTPAIMFTTTTPDNMTNDNDTTNATTTSMPMPTTFPSFPTFPTFPTVKANDYIVQRAAPQAASSSDSCKACCNTDMCNKRQCETTPILSPTHPASPHPCVDQKGKDFCEAAKQYFDGCSNISIAKTICKKTCDLCDLVDGNWSEWGNWSSCDVTCGNGTRLRMRECDSPEPKAGGDNCTGSDMEAEACTERYCPVDGDWTNWSAWSSCSVTCGVGLQKRQRNCSNPYPDAEGLFCLGDSVDEQICFQTHCHDGEWQDWSEWSDCSATCDTGLRVRSRNCSEVSFFGQSCIGDTHETALCTLKTCHNNVDSLTIGEWSAWEAWGACSKTCGVGMRTRTRDCNETICVGDRHEFDLCETSECKEEVPAFLVTGVSKNGAENGTIVLSHVITNIDDVYNTTSGEFVCERPGLYNFFISIEKQPEVNQAYCHLFKNDERIVYVGSRSAFIHDNVYQQASNSAVILLDIGDVVYLGACSDANTFTVKTTFSGSLIH